MPTVISNGIRMHYEERGSGDPLILIMGLGALGSRWKDHVASYEKHFRCILPNNRGASESDKAAGPYTIKMMADDTAGLMLALGIENARIAGISMGSAIAQFNLQLGAIAFVCNWAYPDETHQEKSEAERVYKFARSFPGAHLVLCQAPGEDRSNLRQRQENLISCVNAVAVRAVDQGLSCSYHPHSPDGSVFRIEDDYKILLDALDSSVVGFAPDTGHIVRGGMDAVKILNTYRSLIKHVHFKDITASGGWTAMGAGIIDFPGIVTMLKDTGYAGWIMIEEESPEAEVDPNTATTENGEYLRRSLLPIV